MGEKFTTFVKEAEIQKKWHVVDAEGKVLGRLASRVAHLLRGKHKPSFTPNVDVGDFVVVINASKVRLTGKREELKEYFHHTGYPGGVAVKNFRERLKKNPEGVVSDAVKGMLPHNRLGNRIFKKLKVYAGNTHPHSAQVPDAYKV